MDRKQLNSFKDAFKQVVNPNAPKTQEQPKQEKPPQTKQEDKK
jgi:hypothetical protein